ncbi:MAG: VWA domain-containing protein [Anaerolineaceae bacterium]|nr:VWA domain-containing protein [Anaerolineaceae bacterium]
MILAIALINPWLLAAGSAMASIPVIIHLLNRLRFRRVVWAAMEFLLAAHRKNARRVRLEQIILLVVRTLIILLLAAAVARPVITGLLGAFGRSATHAILLIDDSFSMSAPSPGGVEGKTVMQDARQAAARLVKGFDQRDGLSLVLAGSRPHGRITAASFDHQQMLKEIEGLQASDSATDMVGALETVRKIIDQSDLEQKQVYVLTDNTRAAWLERETGSLASVAAAVSEKAALVIVDFGQDKRSNLAILSLQPDKAVVTTGIDSAFRIKVENFSDQPVPDVVVNMTVDGQRQRPVVFGEIGPRTKEVRRWAWNFREARSHTLMASLEETGRDELAPDSVRYLAVKVQEAINVLLVDGEPSEGGGGVGEVFYLREALDPRGRDNRRATSYNVRTVRDTEFSASETEDIDFVILANVASLSGSQTRALEYFAEKGGSVIFFLGDQVRQDEYNASLYMGGKGLLPASLAGTRGTTEPGRPDQYTTFDVGQFDHPALARFKAQGGGAGLNRVQVNKYYQLNLPVKDDAAGLQAKGQADRVILHFANAGSSPAIVEKRYGRGRVVVVATTADTEWTDFAKLPPFLQLTHELMKYLMPKSMWRYNRTVDSVARLPVSAADYRTTFVMEKPGGLGSLVNLTPREIGAGRRGLVIGDLANPAPGAFLDKSGIYTIRPVRGKSTGSIRLSANVDVAESDLAHLSEDALGKLLGRAPMVFARGQEGLREALLQQQAAGGWARNLLWAMVGLLLVETFLAWFFNRGK